jgi:hypothetical protein
LAIFACSIFHGTSGYNAGRRIWYNNILTSCSSYAFMKPANLTSSIQPQTKTFHVHRFTSIVKFNLNAQDLSSPNLVKGKISRLLSSVRTQKPWRVFARKLNFN